MARFLDRFENRPRLLVESPPGVGEQHLASQPLEKRLPQLAFQLDDLLAERGLRDQATLCGAGKALQLGYRRKVAQLVELHRQNLSFEFEISISLILRQALDSRPQKS